MDGRINSILSFSNRNASRTKTETELEGMRGVEWPDRFNFGAEIFASRHNSCIELKPKERDGQLPRNGAGETSD